MVAPHSGEIVDDLALNNVVHFINNMFVRLACQIFVFGKGEPASGNLAVHNVAFQRQHQPWKCCSLIVYQILIHGLLFFGNETASASHQIYASICL